MHFLLAGSAKNGWQEKARIGGAFSPVRRVNFREREEEGEERRRGEEERRGEGEETRRELKRGEERRREEKKGEERRREEKRGEES